MFKDCNGRQIEDGAIVRKQWGTYCHEDTNHKAVHYFQFHKAIYAKDGRLRLHDCGNIVTGESLEVFDSLPNGCHFGGRYKDDNSEAQFLPKSMINSFNDVFCREAQKTVSMIQEKPND